MKPLTLELEKGAKRQLQSLGWKTPKVDDHRRHFFASERDKPVIVTPKVAVPTFYDPSHQAKAVFANEPFPEAVCVEISPCRLLPPPCYRSPQDFETYHPCHSMFEPWKCIYLQTHEQVLILDSADDAPLQGRLEQWLKAMRVDYEREVALWRARIERATNLTLQELDLPTEESRASRLRELREQLDMVESETPIDGMPCKGSLKLTLDDVKINREGIRDRWMHEEWARENGEDLVSMRYERGVFRRWLESNTGTPANIINATRRVPDPNDPTKSRPTGYTGLARPHFGERYEQNPTFLEACAMVRFRARFADSASTVVYLANCEVRDELTADEIDEASKLAQHQSPPEPTPWHSEGFATIYRCNSEGDVIETLPLTNEFKALCQLVAKRPDQIAQYSELEPQIGTRAQELDVAAGVLNPAAKGERRVRDMLRTETGQRLLNWGVLTEIEVGREKFLKLAPPKSA